MKTDLILAHNIFCKVGALLVFQIVLRRFSRSETKLALAKAKEGLALLEKMLSDAG